MDPQQGLGSGFDRRDHLVMNVQLLNSQYPPSIMFKYLKMMLKALLSLASVVNIVGPGTLNLFAERVVVFYNGCGTA
jgi:hypothetical protein